MQYIEDTLDKIKEWIETNLDTYLSTIEENREIEVERPAVVRIWSHEKMRFPMIEIQPEETEIDYRDDSLPLDEGFTTHTISIYIAHSGQDADLIGRGILRYTEALRRMIDSDFTLGGQFNRVRMGLVEYSSMIEAQEDKRLAQFCRVEITARTY